MIERIVSELELDAGLVAAAADRLGRPSTDPLAAIIEPYGALVAAACASGDHEAEARLASALIDATEGIGPEGRALAWRLVVDVTRHLDSDAGVRAARLRPVVDEAAMDIAWRVDQEGRGPGATRALVDPIAEVLLAAEVEAGLEPSGVTDDLARRRRARQGPRPRSLTFMTRHPDGVASVWARDGREWFADRYRDRHGGSPPEGWWIHDPESAMGGRIDAEFGHLFDASDRVDFLEEMERRYRAERGLPALGRGWVSQRSLQACVEDAVGDVDVIAEARLPWLDGQRLDIFIPSLEIAFEFQGEQHFFPLDHWGGQDGLTARQALDERKRDACARQGIRLIEWRYDEPISVEAVRERLRTGLGGD
jgi:hypothetical protein